MSHMNFVPKKTQLEQLHIEFDDANEIGSKDKFPVVVNSKEKYNQGPSNN